MNPANLRPCLLATVVATRSRPWLAVERLYVILGWIRLGNWHSCFLLPLGQTRDKMIEFRCCAFGRQRDLVVWRSTWLAWSPFR